MLNLHQQCLSDHEFNATMPNPRPKGELAVTHKGRGVKLVLAPPHSPITLIYRNGCHQLKLAETEVSQEQLASFSALKGFGSCLVLFMGAVLVLFVEITCLITCQFLAHMTKMILTAHNFMNRTFHCSPPQAHSQDE